MNETVFTRSSISWTSRRDLLQVPVGESIEPVGETAVDLGIIDVVKTFECVARLDQRRDAAGETIALGVTLAKLGREHIGQLDLADLGLDLGVRHLGVDVMLKTVLGKESDEQLLREVGVGVVPAFLDEETRTLRRTDQRVGRDDAVQLGPDLVDVRRLKTVVPLAYLYLSVLGRPAGGFPWFSLDS